MERLQAVIDASFAEDQFAPEVVSAWLVFYAEAQRSRAAARLLNVYVRRLHSNLTHDLRPMLGERSDRAAKGLAAMIDGVYIRQALQKTVPDRKAAMALVLDYLDCQLAREGKS